MCLIFWSLFKTSVQTISGRYLWNPQNKPNDFPSDLEYRNINSSSNKPKKDELQRWLEYYVQKYINLQVRSCPNHCNQIIHVHFHVIVFFFHVA